MVAWAVELPPAADAPPARVVSDAVHFTMPLTRVGSGGLYAGVATLSHGEAFTWMSYWPQFLASTFENWQSEWLQLIFQAILLLGAKHWLFQVDAEDMERLEKKVDAVAERLGIDPDESQEPAPEQHQPV